MKLSKQNAIIACRLVKLTVGPLALLLVLIASNSSRAQTVHDFGSWFSLNTQGKLNLRQEGGKLLWWFDGHLRYLDDSDGFHQSILRPGIGYQLNPDTNLWLGYAWINTLPTSGAAVFDEHRIWQQLMWSQKFEQFSFLSRSRFEQRFVETGDDTGLRFRQFLKVDRPLYQDSPLGLVVWNEAFFTLNETDWGQQGSLGQNRLFAGLGRKFAGPNKPKLEVGYLNQFIRRKSATDRMSHIISTQLVLDVLAEVVSFVSVERDFSSDFLFVHQGPVDGTTISDFAEPRDLFR